MSYPKVSIVIPSYKPGHFEQCLRSAIGQTYPNIEIMVSDNCPTEEIRDICARYPQVIYQRNVAIREDNLLSCFYSGKGQYIKPLFDDGHATGIYTWSYLQQLGAQQEEKWAAYLQALAVAGKSREPDVAATALARELSIPTVLVPARPGITNALGCVVADLRHDYVRTVNKPLSALQDAAIAAIYAEQGREGRATIESEGVPVRELRYVYSADMQFAGQSHILSVAVEQPDIGIEGLHKAFAAAYWRRFGIELAEIPPVLVNLHTAVIGVRPEIDLAALAATERAPTLAAAKIGERRVWFPDGWLQAPVYARDRLPLDASFQGPAILEQLDCTTVVEPGDRVRQDKLGNLLIDVGSTGSGRA